MLEILREKTEELVMSVYKLALASDSIEDVELAEIEPNLAEELDAVDARVRELTEDVHQLETETTNVTDVTDFIKKINKIIDGTDMLDSRILAMPRPKSRVGRPKYYERMRMLIEAISNINGKINIITQRYLNNIPDSPDTLANTPD